MTGKQPVTFEGRLAGYATMVTPGTVSVELLPEMAGLLGEGLVGGLSIGPRIEATAAAGVASVFETSAEKMRELRESALQLVSAEGPSPSVGPVPEPIAGRPCGCLPGEECMFCRNSFAFRREVRPPFPEPKPVFLRQNWEAIQDELGVNLRGEPVPGFKRAPFPFRVDTEVQPADVEGVEVQALLCSTDSHAGTVPAVVFGTFRVPWWSEERTEPAAYCGSCARVLGFMGYFTPDEVQR